jgi:hypothetical protein
LTGCDIQSDALTRQALITFCGKGFFAAQNTMECYTFSAGDYSSICYILKAANTKEGFLWQHQIRKNGN